MTRFYIDDDEGYFYIVGRELDISNELFNVDPMPLLLTINPRAVTFFIKLYTLRNDVTNIVEYTPKDLTEAPKVSKWYKDLNKIKLIKRIKPRTYLINPHMFLPRFEFFEPVAEHWKKVNP